VSATSVRKVLLEAVCSRRHSERTPHGVPFCARRRQACSPATSSPWRLPSCNASTSCSSFPSRPGGSST
jgi:hypothetical protein